MYKFFLSFSLLCFFSISNVHAMTNLGVIADVDPNDQVRISRAIPTTQTTNVLKQQPGSDIQWLDRPQCDTYHITLDVLVPTAGAPFTQPDVDQLEVILNNFQKYSKKLNNNGSNGKYYMGNGYELVLFTHAKVGNSMQHNEFTAKNIQTLPQTLAQVDYANLVLRIGTNGELRDDWMDVRTNILTRPHHKAVFNRANELDIKTHVTIANFYKYDGNVYHVNNGKVEDIKNPGKKVFNSPYVGKDLNLLVEAFQETNKNFQPIQNIKINRLLITSKNGATQTLKTVVF